MSSFASTPRSWLRWTRIPPPLPTTTSPTTATTSSSTIIATAGGVPDVDGGVDGGTDVNDGVDVDGVNDWVHDG